MMRHYGDFEWGFGNGLYNNPKRTDVLRFEFPVPEHFGTMREEINKTALKLRDDYQGEQIVLGLSGGYDSQAIAIAFMEEKIPFYPVISLYHYQDEILNMEELEAAKAFCDLYHIDMNYRRVDLEKALPKYREMAKNHYPMHWIRYMHLDLALQYRSNLVVLGNGVPFPALGGQNPLDMLMMLDLSGIAFQTNLNLIDRFYQYRSEMYFARLRHPYMLDFIKAAPAMQADYRELTADKPQQQAFLIERYVKPLMFASEYGANELIHQRKLGGFEAYPDYFKTKGEFQAVQMKSQYGHEVVITQPQWETILRNPGRRAIVDSFTKELRFA
jgi:hypothetical protein